MRDLLITKAGPFLKGLLGAAVGTAIVYYGIHAYNDHRALHDLITLWNMHGAKIEALPSK